MYINYPFQVSRNGRIAEANQDEHIRQLIEQLLFTMPGERVNRPDFGSGLMQLVFAPNSSALTTTYEFLVQGALQAYLGSIIRLDTLTVNNEDAVLNVNLQYTLLETQEQRTLQLSSPIPEA